MVSKVDAVRVGMNQTKKVCTLVYLLDNDSILLGLKKRGIGEGKWNGFGGKVHINEGETIVEGAIREVEEECGIIVQKSGLRYTGTIDFEFIGSLDHYEVHVFESRHFSGDVIESDEMRPKWFSISDIPYNNMWLDKIYWHPVWLQGKKFKAYFLYEGHDNIVKYKIDDLN